MAMAVAGKNRHYRWKEIGARHWLELARRCGFGGMQPVMQSVIAQTPEVIEQVRGLVPAGFSAPLADAILDGIKAGAEQLKSELAAGVAGGSP